MVPSTAPENAADDQAGRAIVALAVIAAIRPAVDAIVAPKPESRGSDDRPAVIARGIPVVACAE
jgi:hypothetical protein